LNQPQKLELSSRLPFQRISSMNILLVEDEPLIQKSLKKLLEKKGATVTAVGSGREAISLILENTYDRIICDLMLQDLSGFDIIEESKKKFASEQIGQIFIIITAYSSSQVLSKAREYGCRVLTKPFDNLNEAIELFIKKDIS
jgi:CheY-like chemotaxis protein